MNTTASTVFGDIAPVGAELEESVLRGVTGGKGGEAVTQIDPPGVCQNDQWY